MKSSDIAMIILIASLSVTISFFVVRSIPFFQVQEQDAIVQQIELIRPDITSPDPEVFNKDAINPTIPALIGSDRPPEKE